MPEAINILDTRRLPWPVAWRELFQREAPLWVEVGFGNGQFLVDLAMRNPDANVVGIEISQPSLRKAVRKLTSRGVENACIIRGGAEAVFWTLCRPGSVDRVYINFPDPWPKAAHHHRRLIDEQFLRLLATRMPAGAHLEIATDHAEYASVIAECLQASPHFDSRLDILFATEDPERLRTKYEQIALDEGRSCHYFKWERNGVATTDSFPIPAELPMPHIIMHSPLSLDSLRDRFEPVSLSEEGRAVRFVALYQAQEDETLLVDTYVDEEPVAQRVGLTIRARPGDEVILALHELGFPRPTSGVHWALSQLAQRLEELDPEMRVVKSNVQTDR